MKRKEIKKEINSILKKQIPSSFEDIAFKIKNDKGVVLNMKKEKNKNNFSLLFKVIPAVAIILILSVFGLQYYNNNHIMASIFIDVNPSIELQVNSNKTIKKVIANNKEAKEVIGTMDLVGSSLEVGTNAIIGSMLKLNYITNDNNSILISVIGNKKEENKIIEENLTEEINSYLTGVSIDGSIISQSLSNTETLKDLAGKYNITVGKAELISKIVSSNPLYSFDELVKLSTNELNLLVESDKNKVDNVKVNGNASQSSYIGEEKAKQIAIKHSKVNSNDVNYISVKMDYENKQMVYEVEFIAGNKEYEYDVNATNGNVLDYEKDYDDDKVSSNNNTSNSTNNYISKTKAKDIALKHAKVDNYRSLEIEFDQENGVAIYEISFEYKNKEYEYEVNAIDGKIISSAAEYDD